MENLKLITQIAGFAKNDIRVKIKDKVTIFRKPNKVIISPLFFRSAKCQRCGRSCRVGFDLWYTTIAPEMPQDFVDKLKIEDVEVNGKQKKLYYYKNPRKTPNCDFLEEESGLSRCGIHGYKPIHCALPSVQIDSIKGTTYLIKRLFKRNYSFGCKSLFGKFDYEEFIQWDLHWLMELEKSAKDFEIETYLPEMFDWFYRFNSHLMNGMIPDKQIIFY